MRIARWYGGGLITCLLMLTVLSFAKSLNHLAKISTDRRGSQPIYRLQFDQLPHFKGFGLSHPDRYVLDVFAVSNPKRLKTLTTSDPVVKQIRVQQHGHNVRLVFDLAHSIKPEIARHKRAKNRFELALRFPFHRPMQAVHKPVKPVSINTPVKKHVQAVVKRSIAKTVEVTESNLAPRRIVVVIDPGHGGKDPGAHGPHGVREKQVVLAISKKLAKLINQQPGFEARLTRHNDRFLKLRERLHKARKFRADAFVAVHADAYMNRHAHGASVFALSERGATSEAARWIAEKENVSELMGGARLDGSEMLRSVLIDLQQTVTIAASLDMGNRVLHNLDKSTHLHHHKVEQAAFVVLKSPDIPSILVESGFISNPSEERRLRSGAYQLKIATAIKDGIIAYFKQHPEVPGEVGTASVR